MKTCGRVIDLLRRLQVPKSADARFPEAFLSPYVGDPLTARPEPALLRVDEVGVGRGVADRLKEQGFLSAAFNSSKRPETAGAAERYQNLRAEAYDRFRTMLVKGQVALPPDPLLEEEMLTCRAFTNSSGKLQIVSKLEWREVLGRSPDRLDAVVIAVAATGSAIFAVLSEPVAF